MPAASVLAVATRTKNIFSFNRWTRVPPQGLTFHFCFVFCPHCILLSLYYSSLWAQGRTTLILKWIQIALKWLRRKTLGQVHSGFRFHNIRFISKGPTMCPNLGQYFSSPTSFEQPGNNLLPFCVLSPVNILSQAPTNALSDLTKGPLQILHFDPTRTLYKVGQI